MSTSTHRRSTARAGWDAYWFAQVPPHIYALLRILFGAVGLASLVGLLDFPLFWSCTGLVIARESSVCAYAVQHSMAWAPGLAVLTFAVASFTAMAVGYRSRVATAASFVAVFALLKWNTLPLSAAHQVLRCMLFCLIWADTGRVWSLDARLRASADPEGYGELAAIWPLRLMRIQIGTIYFVTGLWKLNNVMWRDGSAMHYVLQDPQYRRWSLLASSALDPWTTLATYTTLFWELSFPLLLLFRPTRRWTLIFGVLMHVGMWWALELGPFSWVMLASYVAFASPEAVSGLTGRSEGGSLKFFQDRLPSTKLRSIVDFPATNPSQMSR